MNTPKHTPEQIAIVLGCTAAQAQNGLLRSAQSIRKLSDQDLSQWGKSKCEASQIASEFESRAALAQAERGEA